NLAHFPQVSSSDLRTMMWGGVRFDLVALLYLNVVYIILAALPVNLKFKPSYRKMLKWIFIVCNSLGVAVNIIDFAYYPFTLKRTTGTIFDQFSHEENLSKLFFDFVLEYWYLLIVFLCVVW